MRVVVLVIIAYLCGGALTYGKVYGELSPPAEPEIARAAALDAALKWPVYYWGLRARQ